MNIAHLPRLLALLTLSLALSAKATDQFVTTESSAIEVGGDDQTFPLGLSFDSPSSRGLVQSTGISISILYDATKIRYLADRPYGCEVDSDGDSLPDRVDPEPSQSNAQDLSRYLWVKDQKTWAEARDYAESLGGQLVAINDATENALIYALVSEGFDDNSYKSLGYADDGGGATYVWLGASDIDSEGTFVWESGEDFSYTNWGAGNGVQEPDDDGNGQDALGLALEPWPLGSGGAGIGTGGEWNDIGESNTLTFVVEFEEPQLDNIPDPAATCVNEDISGLAGIQVQEDASDSDGDSSTNTRVLIAYFDKDAEWPATTGADGSALQFPALLLTSQFARVDPLFEGETVINFKANEAQTGNTLFVPDPVTVTLKGDEEPPVITLAQESVTITAQGPLTTEENSEELREFISTITVTDNRGELTPENVMAYVTVDGALVEAPEGFPPGEYTITLIAVDLSGNESEAVELTLIVKDEVKPVISAEASVEFEATSAQGIASDDPKVEEFAETVYATDNVDLEEVEVVPTVDGQDLPAYFPLGDPTVVTLTATDSSGNVATATLTVTVVDTTQPVILSSEGVTLEATGPEGYTGSTEAIIAAIQVEDLVDPMPTVALAEGGSPPYAIGETSVGITVTDSSNNSVSGSIVVTVADTKGPSFSGANPLVLTVADPENPQPISSGDSRVVAWVEGVTAFDKVDEVVEVLEPELPSQFELGETEVEFTAEDSRGNRSSVTVIVLVAVGPSVDVADPITLVTLDGEPIPASNPLIAGFLDAVTAQDFDQNPLDVTNDAPGSFPVGETLVTFTAIDEAERQGQNSSTVTVIIASGDNDNDGDGIDDLYEVEQGLDPNDADDAEGDADLDGRSNLDEYLEGKDPNADDVEPVVTAPGDLTVNSKGLVTAVALGDATAEDVLDGELTATPDNPGPYEPGSYTITWSATDAAGNVGMDKQMLVVLPQVTTVPKVRTAEGQTVMLDVVLNGESPEYPVEIPVTFGGTATLEEDYTVDAEMVTIADGRKGKLTLTILSDELEGEGSETIEVMLVDPAAHAVLGSAKMSTITIVEEAAPPVLKITVTQGDSKGKRVSAGGGDVSAMVSIVDPNGEHTIDWSGSDESLQSTTGTDTETFTFDPSALEAGSYNLVAAVTDSGIADTIFTIGVTLQVAAEEVEPDADGDGIPDIKDTNDQGNVIAMNADAGTAAAQADEGVSIVIGDVANSSGNAGIGITEEQLATTSGGEDADYDYPAGILDFEVQDLAEPGTSFRIVIPLAAAVPEGGVLRKFTEANGWNDFVVDDNNAVASALGENGACPDLGSELYVAGLTAGDTCMQLTLQDGGPNDADGEVNGSYKDPSGIAEATPIQVVDINPEGYQSRRRVGGGCSVVEGATDAGLLVLMLLGLAGLLRRRFTAA